MNNFYSDSQRALQDEFASRALADRLEQLIVRQTFDEPAQAFIEAADYFFLSTVDEAGFPTVSYKGGDPGFVKVTGPDTLLLPCYDGNGMYYSMGNIAGHALIGLLFIDFETPHRIRIQGEATLTREQQILELWPEVALAVEVQVTNMWVNCPRYVHRMQKLQPSEFVPRTNQKTPQPEWKSMEAFADIVPPPAHTL